MKVKVQVHTGTHTPEPCVPGDIVDLREPVARDLIRRGWAVALMPEVKAEEKAEVIETPEDDLPQHETASLKRKKK